MDRNEYFEEWLDEVYEPVEIAGVTIAASTVLRECDPIAYRCAVADWEDGQEAQSWN